MASWRKHQAETRRHNHHHQMGVHRRKPPSDKWQLSVPSWEKQFCASVGMVPWQKLIETKKYMFLHDEVLKWDDSASKEAFDNAKNRFWAEINGLPCHISLPDPDMYIDNVDWNSSVDPELFLDLDKAKIPSEEERDEQAVIISDSLLLGQSFFPTAWGELPEATGWEDAEEDMPKPTGWGNTEVRDEQVVILGDSLCLNQSFSPVGWGDAEKDMLKPAVPIPAAQGWEPHLHENNNGVASWEQYRAPDELAQRYEWKNGQNDSWGWNQSKHFGGDLHKMGRGRAVGDRRKWDGHNRRGENMSWNDKMHAYNGDAYQMHRGRRNNNGGGRRGNFA